MEKISSLVETLAKVAADDGRLAGVRFTTGTSFAWNHQTQTISYNTGDSHADAYLLHEFGHALLGHRDYTRDIDLLKMERDAWERAASLGLELDNAIDTEIIEEALDSYRNWLHDRSLCPSCSHTGIQTERHQYQCVACSNTWRVNEARTCALRRYPTKKRSI